MKKKRMRKGPRMAPGKVVHAGHSWSVTQLSTKQRDDLKKADVCATLVLFDPCPPAAFNPPSPSPRRVTTNRELLGRHEAES